MLLLLVNLYEFGQFLRILLWISIPLIVLSMLITTWLHYRRKRKEQDSLVLSMEGLDPSAPPDVLIATMNGRPVLAKIEGEGASAASSAAEPAGAPTPGREDADIPDDLLRPEDKDNLYRGILWMKEKYEQYRDIADQKIFELKDQLRQAREGIAGADLHKRLEEKDRIIEDLQRQLLVQNKKIEELVDKLQNSSQLLLNISHELDRSFPASAAETAAKPAATDQGA